MSIQDEISHRVGEGRLFLHQPALPGAPSVREMFLSKEIDRLIHGPWESTELEIRCGRLRADLDMFVEGGVLGVAQHPYRKKKSAYMAPLDPMSDEVWDIRSRDPKPAIRVLGRFAGKDLFVALVAAYRADLGGPNSEQWRNLREACKAEWRNLFPTYPAHSGDNPHDYISNIILV